MSLMSFNVCLYSKSYKLTALCSLQSLDRSHSAATRNEIIIIIITVRGQVRPGQMRVSNRRLGFNPDSVLCSVKMCGGILA